MRRECIVLWHTSEFQQGSSFCVTGQHREVTVKDGTRAQLWWLPGAVSALLSGHTLQPQHLSRALQLLRAAFPWAGLFHLQCCQQVAVGVLRAAVATLRWHRGAANTGSIFNFTICCFSCACAWASFRARVYRLEGDFLLLGGRQNVHTDSTLPLTAVRGSPVEGVSSGWARNGGSSPLDGCGGSTRIGSGVSFVHWQGQL